MKVLIAAFALCVMLAAVPLAGAQTAGRELPRDYKSDGCSLFPDCNYRECCVEHDKAYFFGGTKKERREADKKLYECVRARGRGFVAKMMWVGVRVGGVAFLPTPFRWGFGRDWKEKGPECSGPRRCVTDRSSSGHPHTAQ